MQVHIRDGDDSSCIADASIRINGLVPPQAPYDSARCRYALSSPAGPVAMAIAKEGYDTLALDRMDIRYRDDGCCGNLEDKTIDILWYKTGMGRAPVVEVR